MESGFFGFRPIDSFLSINLGSLHSSSRRPSKMIFRLSILAQLALAVISLGDWNTTEGSINEMIRLVREHRAHSAPAPAMVKIVEHSTRPTQPQVQPVIVPVEVQAHGSNSSGHEMDELIGKLKENLVAIKSQNEDFAKKQRDLEMKEDRIRRIHDSRRLDYDDREPLKPRETAKSKHEEDKMLTGIQQKLANLEKLLKEQRASPKEPVKPAGPDPGKKAEADKKAVEDLKEKERRSKALDDEIRAKELSNQKLNSAIDELTKRLRTLLDTTKQAGEPTSGAPPMNPYATQPPANPFGAPPPTNLARQPSPYTPPPGQPNPYAPPPSSQPATFAQSPTGQPPSQQNPISSPPGRPNPAAPPQATQPNPFAPPPTNRANPAPPATNPIAFPQAPNPSNPTNPFAAGQPNQA